MNLPKHPSRTLPRFLLTAMTVLALAACSHPGPSNKKVFADIKDTIYAQTLGLLVVTAVHVDKTENPAEDRANFNVTATLKVPDNKQALADSITRQRVTISPITGKAGSRSPLIYAFFDYQGWKAKAVQKFLQGDRTTKLPFTLSYRMKSKDVWALKLMLPGHLTAHQ